MNRSLITVLVSVLFAIAAEPIFAQTTDESESETQKLHELFQQHDDWEMAEYPGMAMSRGDYSNADKLTDISMKAVLRRHEVRLERINELKNIDRSKLSESDRLNYDLFAMMLKRRTESHQYRTFLAPIDKRSGPQQSVPQMAEHVRFESFRDYVNYIRRLEQWSDRMDEIISLMTRGMTEKRTPPVITMEGVVKQYDVLLQPQGLDMLLAPFDDPPAHISTADLEALRLRCVRSTLPVLQEKLADMANFLQQSYLPLCRNTTAASTWPDGENYYNFQLRSMTTTDMTAQDIHDLGLKEVARIKAEMMSVIRSSDYMEKFPDSSALDDETLFKVFIEYLRTDARFYHETEEELLDGYRAICKEVDGWLPKFFRTLPRLPYGVREIPMHIAPGQTTAYYNGGDIRNAEPGWFYANVYALDQRPKYEMIALAMHEAVPGHHLQTSLARELDNLPEFRKHMWFTAFGEGWALYSERLGLEMNLYDDPYDNFGRLLYEMWRACRLVVDTGLHAFDLSRQDAIDYMLNNTALSTLNIENEIDRYINWPGQACAYKIGELKIRELRAKAENELGEKFDVRAFHDVVLGAGSIPLNILENRVNEWIASASQ